MMMSMNPGYFHRKQKENEGKRTSLPLSFPPGPSCLNVQPVSKLFIWVSGASRMRMRNKRLGGGKRELAMIISASPRQIKTIGFKIMHCQLILTDDIPCHEFRKTMRTEIKKVATFMRKETALSFCER